MDALSVTGSSVPATADVCFSGAIEAMDATDGLVAVGAVTAPWTGDCRRCLGQASGSIDHAVREIFEASPVEGETYALESDVVDLEPMIREAVILDLPEAPLCRSDCRGLCAVCGVDRNEVECDCVVEAVDPRWGALDLLKGLPDS